MRTEWDRSLHDTGFVDALVLAVVGGDVVDEGMCHSGEVGGAQGLESAHEGRSRLAERFAHGWGDGRGGGSDISGGDLNHGNAECGHVGGRDSALRHRLPGRRASYVGACRSRSSRCERGIPPRPPRTLSRSSQPGALGACPKSSTALRS